ncbi:MAG: Phenylalanine--tRNA ligase beta subunit [Anaerolineales bacterium]|nr:Phenylalanine--tRNA ligase beta subunit [Anaerolineales bacterium]
MKVPISWLKDYVDIDITVEELAERLTLAGLEVTNIEYVGSEWERDKIFVGEILEIKPHPNADRLVLSVVDYGGEKPMTVVTGAPNLKVGDSGLKAPFGTLGARVINGYAEELEYIRIKPAKIRGVRSEGMVLSEKELGLSEDHEGIMLLDEDAPVGTPLADYLGDTVLDFDLTPNLARCFSVIGVAREVAALTGQELRYPDYDAAMEGRPIEGQVQIEIETPEHCPRFTVTLIRDIDIKPSPLWMQRRLLLAGMRPINNIVDVTNYVMLETGQPLHAFDWDVLVHRAAESGQPEHLETGEAAPTIIMRTAEPGEVLTTLDNVDRELQPEDILVTDTAGILSIAGIMGGAESEVSDDTHNVLLEAANWNNISIRRSASHHKLASEAGARFGRGVHPAEAVRGNLRAIELMRRLAGGTVAEGVVDAYPAPPPPVVVELTPDAVERSLGVPFERDHIASILQALKFDVETVGDSTIRATTPDHRLDIEGPHDLIEEVARVHGYDRLPSTLPSDELPPQRTHWDLVREGQARDILVGAGLQEVITYPLLNIERESALKIGEDNEVGPADYITLANPISPERASLRHTLLANLLEITRDNLRFRDRVAVFEIGRVYLPVDGQRLPDEPRRLGIAMTGRYQSSWSDSRTGQLDPSTPFRQGSGQGSGYDFFDLKGVVEGLLDRLHIEGVDFEAGEHSALHPGRTATLSVDGEEVGVLGELHPVVRERFDLPEQPVAVAEIDLDALLEHVKTEGLYTTISRYPAVEQDIALVVGEAVPAVQVRELIREAGGDLLRRVELFDVYTGEQITEGKKSLAYSLTYQAQDRTLTDEEVAEVQERIVQRSEKALGARLRT